MNDDEQSKDTGPLADAPAAIEGPAAERRAWEHWAARGQSPAWAVAAARVLHGWPVGQQLTESEFNDAIKAAGAIGLR